MAKDKPKGTSITLPPVTKKKLKAIAKKYKRSVSGQINCLVDKLIQEEESK